MREEKDAGAQAIAVICVEDLPRAAWADARRATRRRARMVLRGVEVLPRRGAAATAWRASAGDTTFFPGTVLRVRAVLLGVVAFVVAMASLVGWGVYWWTTEPDCIAAWLNTEQALCPPADRPEGWVLPYVGGVVLAVVIAVAGFVLGAWSWRVWRRTEAAVSDLCSVVTGAAVGIAARAEQVRPVDLDGKYFSRGEVRRLRRETPELFDLRERAAEIRLEALRAAYARRQFTAGTGAADRLDDSIGQLSSALDAVVRDEERRAVVVRAAVAARTGRQERDRAAVRRRRAQAIADALIEPEVPR